MRSNHKGLDTEKFVEGDIRGNLWHLEGSTVRSFESSKNEKQRYTPASGDVRMHSAMVDDGKLEEQGTGDSLQRLWGDQIKFARSTAGKTDDIQRGGTQE